MTTLGHSLIGLAALTYCIPPMIALQKKLLWAIVFVALASIPYWPLPGWGHNDLAVSHSLWVNLLFCVLFIAIWSKWLPKRTHSRGLVWCGALTWMSHIILDLLYGNLPGVAIYWPFSDSLASIPLPWLKALPHVPPPFDTQVLIILLCELITFAPLIGLAYWLRRRRSPSIKE